MSIRLKRKSSSAIHSASPRVRRSVFAKESLPTMRCLASCGAAIPDSTSATSRFALWLKLNRPDCASTLRRHQELLLKTFATFRSTRTRAKKPRRARHLLAACLLLLCTGAAAQTPPSQDHAVTAFIAVNVLPMDTPRVLTHQTVLVEDGKIKAIGSRLKVPAKARVVDGHDRAFLTPGLADMHTHADSAEDMQLYLANGVTSVLNMGEASNEFIAHTRPKVNAGKIPGPHVYAAFLVDGSPRYGHFFVTTPDEARALVRLAKTNGYEFIKVYNNLSPECFDALLDEGRQQHVPIIGHGVGSVGLERQLDAGQLMVAHTEEFLYTVFPQTDGHSAPDVAEFPRAIAMIQRNHAFVTADLQTYATIARQWGKPEVVEQFMQQPEVALLSPNRRIEWRQSDYARRDGSLDLRVDFLRKFSKAMSDAGVALITGTDAPLPGLAPGFSLHDDLQTLEGAGLSRYQVLAAATRVPGEFIRRAHADAEPFGTITIGNRADLVLTSKNPLDDLTTLRHPLGVMANGNWYDAARLQAMLDDVRKKYEQALVTHP